MLGPTANYSCACSRPNIALIEPYTSIIRIYAKDGYMQKILMPGSFAYIRVRLYMTQSGDCGVMDCTKACLGGGPRFKSWREMQEFLCAGTLSPEYVDLAL
jgi:hypothetical protein